MGNSILNQANPQVILHDHKWPSPPREPRTSNNQHFPESSALKLLRLFPQKLRQAVEVSSKPAANSKVISEYSKHNDQVDQEQGWMLMVYQRSTKCTAWRPPHLLRRDKQLDPRTKIISTCT
jgi:hypothetical protein